MTPQERAESVVRRWAGIYWCRIDDKGPLVELIRQAIVAGNNDEVERRRVAEELASRLHSFIFEGDL